MKCACGNPLRSGRRLCNRCLWSLPPSEIATALVRSSQPKQPEKPSGVVAGIALAERAWRRKS